MIVVDETSMVSLTMMARLMEAVRPDCRLVLVGDPDQLASVEAGAVLADLVEGLGRRDASTVTRLETSHRFGQEIGTLAGAVRDDRPDVVLEMLRAGGDHLEVLDPDDPATAGLLRDRLVAHALTLRAAAERGTPDAAVAGARRPPAALRTS